MKVFVIVLIPGNQKFQMEKNKSCELVFSCFNYLFKTKSIRMHTIYYELHQVRETQLLLLLGHQPRLLG